MSTLTTQTVSVTIDAAPKQVSADLMNVESHPEWGTEFFSEGVEDLGDGSWRVNIPMMGGNARMRIDGNEALGIIDMYIAPEGVPFGAPLPVRVVPNGDGSDVLFTLTRLPGQTDEDWQAGIASMQRELTRLKERHDAR